MNMKKICFITTVSITLKAFVVETAKYLHEKGNYDISFICNEDKQFQATLPSYIHFYPVAMERGISFGGLKAMLEIKKIFKTQKFDMIQYSTPNASCYASIAGIMAGVPVRLYCQWGIAYVGFHGLKRAVFKAEEKLVCKLSTWIEPDSFGNLNFSHAEGLYPENKGSVIWNGSASGVNIEKFNITHKEEWRREIRTKYSIPDEAKVFIFIGRITRDKGINELLEATRKIFAKKEDIYLLMVGDAENTGSLKEDLYNWSVGEERIIYCGFTNEVEKYLAASDIYVLPSYREGFGSAVVEAEAMGLPVIVSDIPGPTDAMKKDTTGLVVTKGSADDLETAMYSLYEQDDMRNKFGNNAYDLAVAKFEQRGLFEHIFSDRKRLLQET